MASLAEPHLFRFVEDPADDLAGRLGHEPPLRPIVPVALGHLGETSPKVLALVDSGSERTLAAPGLARALNVDLGNALEGILGIGGNRRRVQFTTLEITLYDELLRADATALASWNAEIGFVDHWEPPWPVLLGQRGFFNEFTVTMQRHAHALIIESADVFDKRFGIQIESADTSQPRFAP